MVVVVVAMKIYKFSFIFRNPAQPAIVCTSSAGKNWTFQLTGRSFYHLDFQQNVSGENFSVMEELIVPGHMLNLQVSFPIKNELGGPEDFLK